jgi:heme A synthase
MKDILNRALKTFFQGFLGALVVTLPNSDLSDRIVVKSLLIGAISGGISALMNLVLNNLNKESDL